MAYQFNPFTSKFDIVTDISGAELLDGTNQPATGNKNIQKVDPEHRLTDTGNSEYTRITKADTSNVAQRFNRVSKPGGAGQAVNLVSGGNDKMTSASAVTSYDDNQDHSYELWYYPTAYTSNTTALIDFGLSTGSSLCFYFPSGGGQQQLNFYNGDGAVTVYGTPLTINAWNHIVVTHNGSNRNVKFYVNGSQVSVTLQAVGTWTPASTTIQIGKSSNFGNLVAEGRYDEIRIWSKEMSLAEIQTEYAAGSGRYGQASDTGITYGWHLDEGSGTSATSYATALGSTLVTAKWVTGKVLVTASNIEANIWKSQDGTGSAEGGILTIGEGANTGTTILDGGTLKFQISGTEKARLDSVGSLGIGTTAPDATALLDITSTTKGFLPPRMTTVQRDAITSPIAGLIIYNTTTNKLNVRTATIWEAITSA